jgi:hypothetical protein
MFGEKSGDKPISLAAWQATKHSPVKPGQFKMNSGGFAGWDAKPLI